MAYIDQEILERYISQDELIKLTDDDNSGNVNTQNLNEAINSASNEFENFLSGIYQIPSELPPLLVNILCDITIYNLYKRRYRLDMPESITEIYKSAIDKLEKIAKGIIELDLPKIPASGFIKINKSDSDRIFNQDLLDKI